MFSSNTHSVVNRIVSISQPYIRPIVKGKAKSPVEFGAKLDLSVDKTGMCRIEKHSFDAYNESAVLKTAVSNYRERTGHYPERVLADQIYRNRENFSYCSNLGIRLSGKKLGRPKKDADSKAEKKIAYQDNRPPRKLEYFQNIPCSMRQKYGTISRKQAFAILSFRGSLILIELKWRESSASQNEKSAWVCC